MSNGRWQSGHTSTTPPAPLATLGGLGAVGAVGAAVTPETGGPLGILGGTLRRLEGVGTGGMLEKPGGTSGGAETLV